MKTLVESRVQVLKGKLFQELVNMPPYEDGKVGDRKSVFTLATWVEASGDQVKVVVQGYRYLLLGIGRMEARGFVMSRAGEIRDLNTREIYEFT